MKVTETELAGSFIIDIELFSDVRGWFGRYFCADRFSNAGLNIEWKQMNHSCTARKGTVRGMHYQTGDFKEIKLVKCIRGSVFDVIIDLRKDSRTFLGWKSVELSAENKKMLYIPKGFAHGFQSLSDDCELLYHHSEIYQPSAEAGIRYNDPLVNINWPLPVNMISDRDSAHPFIDNLFKGI